MSCEYGILNSIVNTGSNAELLCSFTAPLSIINNAPSADGDTMSLKRRGAATGYQRWEIECGFFPKDTRRIYAHMLKNGTHTTFYCRMPQVYSDTINTDGIAVKHTNQLIPGNSFAKLQGVLGAGAVLDYDWVGSFINFAGHSKVYSIIGAEWNADTSTLDVEVFPPFVEEVVAGSEIRHGSSVTMKSKYIDNKSSVKYVDGVLAEFSAIRIVEDL